MRPWATHVRSRICACACPVAPHELGLRGDGRGERRAAARPLAARIRDQGSSRWQALLGAHSTAADGFGGSASTGWRRRTARTAAAGPVGRLLQDQSSISEGLGTGSRPSRRARAMGDTCHVSRETSARSAASRRTSRAAACASPATSASDAATSSSASARSAASLTSACCAATGSPAAWWCSAPTTQPSPAAASSASRS
jgi:hypothetical protein